MMGRKVKQKQGRALTQSGLRGAGTQSTAAAAAALLVQENTESESKYNTGASQTCSYYMNKKESGFTSQWRGCSSSQLLQQSAAELLGSSSMTFVLFSL